MSALSSPSKEEQEQLDQQQLLADEFKKQIQILTSQFKFKEIEEIQKKYSEDLLPARMRQTNKICQDATNIIYLIKQNIAPSPDVFFITFANGQIMSVAPSKEFRLGTEEDETSEVSSFDESSEALSENEPIESRYPLNDTGFELPKDVTIYNPLNSIALYPDGRVIGFDNNPKAGSLYKVDCNNDSECICTFNYTGEVVKSSRDFLEFLLTPP